jgi:hypothetical protein
LIVSGAVWLPLSVPVMVTFATALTATVVTLKVAVVTPAATVTLVGVEAALLSDKATQNRLPGPARSSHFPVEGSTGLGCRAHHYGRKRRG